VCLICDLRARAKGKSRKSEVVDGKDYSSSEQMQDAANRGLLAIRYIVIYHSRTGLMEISARLHMALQRSRFG
jgi:hypothetical protein